MWICGVDRHPFVLANLFMTGVFRTIVQSEGLPRVRYPAGWQPDYVREGDHDVAVDELGAATASDTVARHEPHLDTPVGRSSLH